MQAKRLLRNTVIYGVAQALIGLRDLLLLAFFANYANETAYGIFTQVLVTVMLLGT